MRECCFRDGGGVVVGNLRTVSRELCSGGIPAGDVKEDLRWMCAWPDQGNTREALSSVAFYST